MKKYKNKTSSNLLSPIKLGYKNILYLDIVPMFKKEHGVGHYHGFSVTWSSNIQYFIHKKNIKQGYL